MQVIEHKYYVFRHTNAVRNTHSDVHLPIQLFSNQSKKYGLISEAVVFSFLAMFSKISEIWHLPIF